jgi:6-phospho-3-hexuloisomerase
MSVVSKFYSAKQQITECATHFLDSVKHENICEFVKLVLTAHKIFVYGAGRSGLVGKAFAMRLVQIGLQAYFIGETVTPIVTPADAVVVISKTGETHSTIQVANIVRRVGAKLVVITGEKGSKLSHIGNIVILLQSDTQENNPNIAPLGTIFENAAFLFFDCLIAELMAKKGETEDSMRARHPIFV